MKEFLTSCQVGSIELEQQRKLRQTIEERWDKLGFCECKIVKNKLNYETRRTIKDYL